MDVIKGITYPRVGIRLQRSRRKSIYEPGCIWVTKKWLLKVEKLLSAGVHVPVVEESKNDTYAYTIRREKGTLEGEKNTFRCKNVIFSSILPCMQIILSKSIRTTFFRLVNSGWIRASNFKNYERAEFRNFNNKYHFITNYFMLNFLYLKL